MTWDLPIIVRPRRQPAQSHLALPCKSTCHTCHTRLTRMLVSRRSCSGCEPQAMVQRNTLAKLCTSPTEDRLRSAAHAHAA